MVRPKQKRAPTALIFDELEEGTTRRQIELTTQDLALEDRYFAFADKVQVRLEVHRMMDHFQVDAAVGVQIMGECCRCLATAHKELEGQLRLLVQRKEASEDELDAVEEEEDLEIVPPGAKEIDLKDWLREAVLLELPIRIYGNDGCRDTDPDTCLDGHPVASGVQERGADPRWAALEALRSPEGS